MPRVDIPVVELDQMAGESIGAGVVADAANDHEFTNVDGRVILLVENGSAGAVQVTIPMVPDPFGRAGNKGPTSVAAGAKWVFGPFAPIAFNQSTGKVHVDVDVGGASIILRALRVAASGV